MFSQTAEYALRAAVAMAQIPERNLTTSEIVVRTKAPAGYISKVLQTLARKGIVRATRGTHGGYQLIRSAGEVTVLEVIDAVDPIKRIHTCPLGLPEHGACLCPLHRRMDDALAEVERALAAATLEQIVMEPTTSVPLAGLPISHGSSGIVIPVID
jgi:Rrf2 family protein